MRADPRCPHCSGKVSATATWCMHCGAEFSEPVEADGGRVVTGEASMDDLEAALHAGDVAEIRRVLESRTDGPLLVGVALAIVALVTFPISAPDGVGIVYYAAIGGIAAHAAQQPSVDDAIRDGGTTLAVAPFLLWIVAAVLRGFTGVGPLDLVPATAYAALVLFAVRRLT